MLLNHQYNNIRQFPEGDFLSFHLRKLGASEGTINQEIQRYQQLESVAVNDIRRDVRKKLRRSSMRVSPRLFTCTEQKRIHRTSILLRLRV